jgi:diguanylate cyclase
MQTDRRFSGVQDRRQPGAMNRRPRGVIDISEQNSANTASAMPAIDEALLSREKSALLRENANLAREEQIHVREDAAHGREVQALQREDSVTVREQGVSEAQILCTTEDDFNLQQLRQANEHLVIASVQSQILTEELERSKTAMSHLAHHDFLTDLPNRTQLNDRIGQAIALAKRHHTKLAVLFLDLDRFKLVNDSFGHATGDKLLQAVAQRLKSATRSTDTVSRYGGDEFVLLLSEVSQEATLALNTDKLHKIVTAAYNIAGNDVQIGATIGISVYPQDGDDAEALIRHADDAMYYAKENGRNKYQFFSQEMRAREIERQGFEASLYQALDQRQFELFYQAQIALESGAITGAEALIRWHHPNRGLLLPGWFVPVAEECGAIVPMGRWVLREACRQAKSWQDAGLNLNVMAVNISAREFENDDFLDHVRTVLQETGLAPHHLELELTETVLMKSIEGTAATLHMLRSMGVMVSIDDFGTGYSSLSYLQRFPVDTIKIDQSFVRDIATGDGDIMVNAIIGIGKSLRHQVIAEGVETAEQLAFLHENHCTAVQGFYLNVPMSSDDFATFLQQGVPERILN